MEVESLTTAFPTPAGTMINEAKKNICGIVKGSHYRIVSVHGQQERSFQHRNCRFCRLLIICSFRMGSQQPSAMDAATVILLLQLVVFSIQTGFLIWYAFATAKIRDHAAEQTRLISEQNQGILKNLERTFAKENLEAEPFFHWRGGLEDGSKYRNVRVENLGGSVIILKMQCSCPNFRWEPAYVFRQGGEYMIHFDIDVNTGIAFGFKYLNRFKEVKIATFHLSPKSIKPTPSDHNYERIGYELEFVRRDAS